MDTAMIQVIVIGVVELLLVPIIMFAIKHYLGNKLDAFDEKRELARVERSEANRRAAEQREAERSIVLAMARTMLLDNYEKCMEKGYYSVEEREVYSLLYRSYADDGGNGVIEAIAPRIRALPTEPTNSKESRRGKRSHDDE